MHPTTRSQELREFAENGFGPQIKPLMYVFECSIELCWVLALKACSACSAASFVLFVLPAGLGCLTAAR